MPLIDIFRNVTFLFWARVRETVKWNKKQNPPFLHANIYFWCHFGYDRVKEKLCKKKKKSVVEQEVTVEDSSVPIAFS